QLRRARCAHNQRRFQFMRLQRIDRLQPIYFVGYQSAQRYAVAIQNAVAGEGGYFVAGQYGTDQIERICGADADELFVAFELAYAAQCGECVGQRELFTGDAGDEAAAADFAARFHAAQYAQNVAPRRQPVGFASEQTPENYAVATQQRERYVFERIVIWLAAGPNKRPAPRILNAEHGGAVAALGITQWLALFQWQQQCANAGKAVGGDAAERDQLAERFFEFARQQSGAIDDFIEE